MGVASAGRHLAAAYRLISTSPATPSNATQAGCRVGEVRTARMGVLQVTQPDSTETTGGGVYDTSTIEKDVCAVVSLTIVVDPAR